MADDNFSIAQSTPIPSVSDADNNSSLAEPKLLELALVAKLKTTIGAQGEFIFPCVPTMLSEFLRLLEGLLKLLGQNPTPENTENLRQLLEKGLLEGYRISPHARLVVTYLPAENAKGIASGITINTKVMVESLADKYQSWPQIRQEPLFGTHADAKVMEIASHLGDPAKAKILDVGAGTGRNSIPLAKLGHRVDAIELTPIFAEKLSAAAIAENLPIEVIQGDILDPLLRLRAANYKLVFASEVLSHFRHNDQVRLFLAKMCDYLLSGGFLLFSAFLAINNYQPDQFAREMSEISWSYMITPDDLASAIDGLPLEFISNESVVEYEQKHLPKEAWPPTNWYMGWATGRDLFPIQQNPPMELRWILLKRR